MSASNPGFDWLNLAGLKSDSDLPPPPVSFGFTPTSSSSSLNLTNPVQQDHSQSSLQTAKSSGSESEQVLTEVEETSEDLSVPLNLDIEQLSPEEAKTYLRWYNDIILTRGTRLIRLHDVFEFLNNFKLSKNVQLAIEKIFRHCVSLNIGEFFALLRVISHTISGINPRRKLIGIPAPLLKPKSILAAKKTFKHPMEDDDLSSALSSKNNSKLDLDTFTQFILTGEKPEHSHHRGHKKRKAKRVKFSDEVSVEPEYQAPVDLSLPMGELLAKVPNIQVHRPPQSSQQQQQPSFVNEEEELRDMQDEVNHFQNVKNVDSASIHGTPSNIPSIFFDEARLNTPSPDFNQNDLLSPNSTGPIPGLLPPSHTGPVPFVKSLLSSNYGMQSPTLQDQGGFLSPHTTGSALALQPAVTGSLSSSMRKGSNYDIQELRTGSVSPLASTNQKMTSLSVPTLAGRNRSASSPIPFQQEPSIADQLQQQYDAHQHQQQQRVTSPIPPPPPPTRRQRNASAPIPPPSRSQNAPPPLPPKVALDNTNPPMNGFQSPVPHHVNSNNPHAVTLPGYGAGSVYDRVLQDFTTNGTPVNGNISSPLPSPAMLGRTNSTADILGDLKALQSEVDRLHYFQR